MEGGGLHGVRTLSIFWKKKNLAIFSDILVNFSNHFEYNIDHFSENKYCKNRKTVFSQVSKHRAYFFDQEPNLAIFERYLMRKVLPWKFFLACRTFQWTFSSLTSSIRETSIYRHNWGPPIKDTSLKPLNTRKCCDGPCFRTIMTPFTLPSRTATTVVFLQRGFWSGCKVVKMPTIKDRMYGK